MIVIARKCEKSYAAGNLLQVMAADPHDQPAADRAHGPGSTGGGDREGVGGGRGQGQRCDSVREERVLHEPRGEAAAPGARGEPRGLRGRGGGRGEDGGGAAADQRRERRQEGSVPRGVHRREAVRWTGSCHGDSYLRRIGPDSEGSWGLVALMLDQ